MTKSLKGIISLALVMIVCLSMLCTTAFAATTASASITTVVTGVDGDKDIKFTYANIGRNYVIASGNQNACGFFASETGSFTVKFSPVNGTGANVSFVNAFTGSVDATIAVPQYVSGMPASLETYVDLPNNSYYYVAFRSASSTPASGIFTIYGVFEEFYNT